jgi:thiol-disulfide isomerase/thioredoxin
MSRLARNLVWYLLAALLLPLGVRAQQETAELSLRDSVGRQHSLTEYRGKIVVLNFWATWCVPCKDEMPIFADMQRRHSEQGLIVVAASLDDSSTQQYIPRFARSYKMDFPILLEATTDHMRSLGLGEAVPSTAFIDRDGHIVARIMGQATRSDVVSRVEWLLNNRQGTAPEPLLDHTGAKKKR